MTVHRANKGSEKWEVNKRWPLSPQGTPALSWQHHTPPCERAQGCEEPLHRMVLGSNEIMRTKVSSSVPGT